MQLLKRIGLYGVSGVGKSTTLTKLIEFNSNFVWLEGAKLLLEVANLSLSDFKRLTELEKYSIREKAIYKAIEIQKKENKHIIIDGHLAFPKNEGGFEDVMTTMDKKFYTDIVYLKMSPKIILERQQNDINKKRDYSVQTIIDWIDFEINQLQKVSFEFNINFVIVESESTDDYLTAILKRINNAE